MVHDHSRDWNLEHCLSSRAENSLRFEDVNTSFFRWSGGREEHALVGLLENVSPGNGTDLSNGPT
jgi:hypothetical protein